MNTLPTTLRKNGFEYNLVTIGNKSFIYQQEYTKDVKYYEVFKKIIAKETTIQNNFIPEHITFPGNEDFGKWAWTFRDKGKAVSRFNELESAL